MTRGDLWWADFGMPVLVIQDDLYNRSRINTVVVLPLTTNLLLADAPGNVLLTTAESGLAKDSVVVVTQISAIDKQRLAEKIGRVPHHILEEIGAGTKLVLGLD